jgi:hypothetical protein
MRHIKPSDWTNELSLKITEFFSSHAIQQQAKDSQFTQRKGVIDAPTFAKAVIFSDFDNSATSLTELAESVSSELLQLVSKQAIDQRFNIRTVQFFKKLLELALQEVFVQKTNLNLLKKFKEVRIKDSTSMQIPDNMAVKYRGSGGSGSPAAIRIQFEYDIKSGKIIDLTLNPFIKQDQTDSIETLDKIEENVLILRDLGYINKTVIKTIKLKNAFIISRLISNANVYLLKNGNYEIFDFEKYAQKIKKEGMQKEILTVYITEDKIPVSLLIEKMPEEEINKRMRKINQRDKKKNRKASEEYKNRAIFNLFITNIEPEILSTELIHDIYRLRWQIELVFKCWKSVAKINKVKKMKVERFECLILARLIWLILAWNILYTINNLMYKNQKKLLSFYMAMKSLKNKLAEFAEAIKKGQLALSKFIAKQEMLALKYHKLSKKRNGISLYNIIKKIR